MRRAAKPVIFSHSNPLGVWRHKRNIRDEAIRACAATGGVVGISGIGLFLGENDNRPETHIAHIEHVVQLVGPDHVGIGLDFVFDVSEAMEYVRANPQMYPPDLGFKDGIRMLPPEGIRTIASGLLSRGYARKDVRKILGGNFLRVAKSTWPNFNSLGSPLDG
jgi:membrane dipeptidase